MPGRRESMRIKVRFESIQAARNVRSTKLAVWKGICVVLGCGQEIGGEHGEGGRIGGPEWLCRKGCFADQMGRHAMALTAQSCWVMSGLPACPSRHFTHEVAFSTEQVGSLSCGCWQDRSFDAGRVCDCVSVWCCASTLYVPVCGRGVSGAGGRGLRGCRHDPPINPL